jgi:hypothetical protein
MPLEFVLAPLQGGLIGLDRVEEPTQLGRFLGGHAAMLVEFNRRSGMADCSFQVFG